jgi:hypothetical protein
MPTDEPAGPSRRRPWVVGVLAALVVGGCSSRTSGTFLASP